MLPIHRQAFSLRRGLLVQFLLWNPWCHLLQGYGSWQGHLRNPIPVEAKWLVAHQKDFSASWLKVGPTSVHCTP